MVTGWKNTRLVDLMHIETGSRNTQHHIDGGKYPFFVRSQQIERINNYNYDCEAVMTAGDGVGAGKVFHYINGKFDAHQRVYVMSQFNGIDGKYFFYFFSANFLCEVEKYTAKSSVDSVRRNMIAEMEISLPPFPEQRAIAAALSDMDAYIAALEKLIAKKQAIKKGAMQELLTGKQRLSGFEGEWVDDCMESYLKFEVGYPFSSDFFNSSQGMRLIKNRDLKSDDQVYYTTENYDESYIVENGDVLIGMDGDFIPCLWNKGIALLNQRVGRVRTYQNMALLFAYYILIKPLEQLQNGTGATTVKHLSHSNVEKLIVHIPKDVTEQTAIAAVLSDMDAEIDALTAKLNKAKHIKQGMMSELLTGRIRLVEQEAPAEAVAVPKIVELPRQETKGHNQQFDDAVMIAGIVNVLYTDKFLLGRKKVQKCLYLLRRHQDVSTAAFKKKAAGPYADEVRYKGGEPIARNANYIATTTTKDEGTTFGRGKNISQALKYIESWGKQDDIRWVSDKLKFKKVDELELLATVDMAICDLEESGTQVSVATIKNLIDTNAEWKAKLKRQTFSDANIARAIRELQTLL